MKKMKKLNKKIGISLITVLLLSGCAADIILPGLCYDDRNGTHMCGIICNEDKSVCIDTDNPKIEPDIDFDKENIDGPDRNDLCDDMFKYHGAEAWANCILIA